MIFRHSVIFPERKEEIKDLIFTYLDGLMAEVFPHYYCLFISISAIFRVKREFKVGTKVLTLGPSLFHNNLSPSKFSMFLFAKVLPLMRILAMLDHTLRSKCPKTFRKGKFRGC